MPGADLTQVRSQLVALVKPYLVVSVQDGSEFADAQGAQIDTVLNLLYVLLLFSVVIAILGIINTLALSVLERTREIGLLRAIGLRRRQLSGMITIEAIATAVFGAVLGTVLGLGLGISLQRGLQTQGLTTLGIPWVLVASHAPRLRRRRHPRRSPALHQSRTSQHPRRHGPRLSQALSRTPPHPDWASDQSASSLKGRPGSPLSPAIERICSKQPGDRWSRGYRVGVAQSLSNLGRRLPPQRHGWRLSRGGQITTGWFGSP